MTLSTLKGERFSVQIAAPTEKIEKECVDRVIRVQARSDIVPNIVREELELVPSVIYPVLFPLSAKYVIELFTQEMPETVYVDINVENEAWGGHKAYFNARIKNKYGIDNVTITVDAFWEKIK